ncbi:MAG TPA: uroporphyrinogen-III synthase [Candidatus Binatia bacterium]|nr:uroporphyrinogen-III synthase [Candidatus Binatia bacterium]
MAIPATDKRAASADVLRGRRILVTRARMQASTLVQAIEALGGEVIEFPTIEISPPISYEPLDQAIQQIKSYDWLIFTSVNGVARFLDRFKKLDKSLADLAGIEIVAIGPATATKLEAAGIPAGFVPQRYQAEGVLETLAGQTLRGKRVLIPRAARARDILPETLRQRGAQVDVVVAYQTVSPQVDVPALCKLFSEGGTDMITFTSSSTASNFAAMLQSQDLRRLLGAIVIACIGPITRKTVEDLGMRAHVVATEFTIPGLVRAIANYFSRNATESCGGIRGVSHKAGERQ